jgi:DNA polymerase-1
MRQLWIAPKNRLLVGVDAEGIQLRIFAHYIDDKEFTYALVHGRKDNKTDPHSLNQRILGSVCKTRASAKRFVYALLLGAGISKLANILGCSQPQAKEALNRLLERYTGFASLRKTDIPRDARLGYFIGLDGRKVPIPGDSQRDREHLCMSGYLQNGEAIVVKQAAIIADEWLRLEKERRSWQFVDIIHDELQSEVRNSVDYAIKIAKIKCEAIEEAGKIYKLKCPMAGSYYNDDTKKNTIGTNWYATH